MTGRDTISKAFLLSIVLMLATACGSTETPEDVEVDTDVPSEVVAETVTPGLPVEVHVTLDGEPSPDTLLVQGGQPAQWRTGPDGVALVHVDLTVPGEWVILASHPDARIRGAMVTAETTEPVQINLTRFDPSDNPDYVYKDPGEPGMSHKIEKCGHCHLTHDDHWFTSAHKTSASNPVVQDIYGGTAAAIDEEELCLAAGGSWTSVRQPGLGAEGMSCVVAPAVSETGGFGACADCHAPGIDGQVGGRDLLDATGYAYDYGIHCDVCHHVESVDFDAAPGVAGRLKIVRPSEEPQIPGVGDFMPLTFCPNHDVPNIYMGCVQRDHFRSSDFCGACHELDQAALMPGTEIDLARWPSGKIPVHSTYSEWEASAFAPGVTCQGCHMPPAPAEILNGADLQVFPAAATGVAGGWPRPPGATKIHSWSGPRSPENDLLAIPLSLGVEKSVADGTLTATVTVTNASAGHAIPTGEPLRSVLLLVDATCDGSPITATGGDVVPDYGGAIAEQDSSGDWMVWPGAKAGEIIRVVLRGDYVDYTGPGRFGDGSFDLAGRGLRAETIAGEATVISVEDGVVVLDGELPPGDVAYRVSPETDAGTWAGHPGTGFARVLVDAAGQRMAPHFMAVDVVSDNRLPAGKSWTSSHAFAATCEEPEVRARLIQRAYPRALAIRRGWPLRDRVWLTITK